MKKGDWYRISSRKATFAVVVADGIVVDAAPIARQSIGRPIAAVVAYYERRFGARADPLALSLRLR